MQGAGKEITVTVLLLHCTVKKQKYTKCGTLMFIPTNYFNAIYAKHSKIVSYRRKKFSIVLAQYGYSLPSIVLYEGSHCFAK